MKLLILHGSSGNFGDTAMLEAVVLDLLRELPTAELFVVDQPGLRTKIWSLSRVHKHPMPKLVFPYEHALAEVPYFWRYRERWRKGVRRWLALGLGGILSAKAIRIADADAFEGRSTLDALCAPFDGLHMVGGGYLTDTFPELLVQVCCLAETFVGQGKPVLLTGQQVGPFQSQTLKALTGRLLGRARFVGLREPTGSVELCQAFHLDPRCFRVTGDDCFGLPSASEAEVSACLAANNLEAGRFLAFNVRLGFYADGHRKHLELIARIAQELAARFSMPVVMVPIAFNDADSDDRSGEELLRLMPNTPARRVDSEHLTPSLVRGLLGKAFGAVGVSYHFCTFALSQGVPCVCLHDGDYYGQKARGICGFWQDERFAISLQKAQVGSIVEQAVALFEDSSCRTKLGRRARAAVEEWQTVVGEQIQQAFAARTAFAKSIQAERLELPMADRITHPAIAGSPSDSRYSGNRKE